MAPAAEARRAELSCDRAATEAAATAHRLQLMPEPGHLEQSALLLLDAVILDVTAGDPQAHTMMHARHTNLE